MSQAGYISYLQNFYKEERSNVIKELKNYVADAGDSQIRAWRDEVRILQEMSERINSEDPAKARSSCLILEYTIPLDLDA